MLQLCVLMFNMLFIKHIEKKNQGLFLFVDNLEIRLSVDSEFKKNVSKVFVLQIIIFSFVFL